MAAYATTYVTLGSLVLRTRAIDCYDWSDLLKVERRGANRVIPGQAGAAVRPRVAAQVRVALPVRVDGNFDGNDRLGGSDAVQHARVYDHLAVLHGAVSADTLTFTWEGGEKTVACVVEEITAPSFSVPGRCEVGVSVTLPDGPLDLS